MHRFDTCEEKKNDEPCVGLNIYMNLVCLRVTMGCIYVRTITSYNYNGQNINVFQLGKHGASNSWYIVKIQYHIMKFRLYINPRYFRHSSSNFKQPAGILILMIHFHYTNSNNNTKLVISELQYHQYTAFEVSCTCRIAKYNLGFYIFQTRLQ